MRRLFFVSLFVGLAFLAPSAKANNVPNNIDAVSSYLKDQGLSGINFKVIAEPWGIYCGDLGYMAVIVPSGESPPKTLLCRDRFRTIYRSLDVFGSGTSLDQAIEFARKHLARYYNGNPWNIGIANIGQCTSAGATAEYCPIHMNGQEFHFFAAEFGGKFVVVYGDEGPQPTNQSVVAAEFNALVRDATVH